MDENNIIVALGAFFVLVIIAAVVLFVLSNPKSPASGGTSGGGTSGGGTSGVNTPGVNPLNLVNVPQSPQSGPQQGTGSGTQNTPCQGNWGVTSTGVDGTSGCTQPCYDAAHNIEGTLVETFQVSVDASGTGTSCLAVAQSQRPGVTVTEDPVTHVITTAPQPCNRNTPCMVNCSLSDTYSTVAGYGVSDSSPLCQTGLVPVEASFTVTPTPPFYNATCSFIVENAHAVDRGVCPGKSATAVTCAPGYVAGGNGPLQAPYHERTVVTGGRAVVYMGCPTVTMPLGCYSWDIGSDYQGSYVTSCAPTQDNSQITSLSCPDGYTTHNPMSSLQCDPIGNWYTCPPGEHRVANIAAQNGVPSQNALPGCAP
jgi:hypothetical protein